MYIFKLPYLMRSCKAWFIILLKTSFENIFSNKPVYWYLVNWQRVRNINGLIKKDICLRRSILMRKKGFMQNDSAKFETWIVNWFLIQFRFLRPIRLELVLITSCNSAILHSNILLLHILCRPIKFRFWWNQR